MGADATTAQALKALVEKLEAIAAHPSYQSQIAMGWVHGVRYDGPNWGEELAQAKAVLAAPAAHPSTVQALIARWRQSATVGLDDPVAGVYESCADDLEAALAAPTHAEIGELKRELAILKLSVPLEDELSDRVDTALKYLAMQQGFTLDGLARLFVDCQRRIAADWVEIGSLRRQVKAALSVDASPPQGWYRAQAERFGKMTSDGMRLFSQPPNVNHLWARLAAHFGNLALAAPAVPVPEGGRAILDRARAAMIRAMDALEADADLDARRQAFEIIQGQFDGVSHEDHDRAESLVPTLKAEWLAWEKGGYGQWPTTALEPSPDPPVAVPPQGWQPSTIDTKETPMEDVLMVKGTVLHANGVPVELKDDTVVRCAYENMRLLTGYHVTPTDLPVVAPREEEEM